MIYSDGHFSPRSILSYLVGKDHFYPKREGQTMSYANHLLFFTHWCSVVENSHRSELPVTGGPVAHRLHKLSGFPFPPLYP